MKKLVSVILMGALMIGAASAAYAGTGNTKSAGNANYSDLKSTNWAYEAVNIMSQKGIVKGYKDGSFKPGNVVTYGEFIKMALVASTGQDVGNSTSGNWAKGYYDKALELKYFGSTDIKADQLDSQIPRSDMALIISSILGDKKIDNYDKLESSLKDVNSTTKHDYDIIKSYASGIITGYEDSTFRPDKTLTRAESATVIYRLIDESKRVLLGTTTNTQKPLAQMITNYKSFLNDNGTIDEDLAATKSYTIDKDNAKYGFTLQAVNGTKAILVPANVNDSLGQLYLIKDNKAITYVDSGFGANMIGICTYNPSIDITKVDYIGSLDIYHNLTLIVNPFKK